MANPNPSPETRFQPGNPGGGKTSEQRALEYEAAEMAARARHKLLSVITEKLKTIPDDVDDLTKLLSSDMLRLFKDSEDRAHGTPKAAIDHTSSDGSMTPKALDASKLSDAALAEVYKAMNAGTDTDPSGQAGD